MTPRYKRSDKHPSNAELIFWRYNRGHEVWISRSEHRRRQVQALAYDKAWKQTPQGRKTTRRYFRVYMRRPEQKVRLSSYYKQAHVRERYRNRYHNDPSVKEKAREYNRKICKTLNYRLAFNLRNRIRRALRSPSAIKSARTYVLIGCSISALRLHLESQFTDQMSWENYGKMWHIDHHIPLALFDLSCPRQQHIAFHFENLRPILALDNVRKSDRVTVDGKEVSARTIRKIIQFKAA